MNTHRSWAEIDLNALRENLAWIRHKVGPRVKIMTVVKADAYGHGLKQIAALLMQSGTDVFGVANLTEAQNIRLVGGGWPILMLGACLPNEAEIAVRDEVMVSVSSLEEAQRLSVVAVRLGKLAGVHLKVDTGMGRLGVPHEQAAALWKMIGKLPSIAPRGIYTHFASAEDDPAFSRTQKRRFARVLACLPHKTLEYVHAGNSAAVLHEPDVRYNTVRPGLLVYGVLPPGRREVVSTLRDHVRPALSWKCHVSFVKEIRPGTPLSYGRSFVAPRKMRVATLTAGYGDGLLRAGSNRARVLVGGQLCRVVGRITMDQTLVDVSKLPSVMPGDEAVLIGQQDREEITVDQLARWCRTVPWETLTAITARVPRIYRGSAAA